MSLKSCFRAAFAFAFVLLVSLCPGAGYPADDPLNITALAIDPKTPSTLYAGTNGGVFRSTDGGATWSATGLAGHIASLAMDPATTTTLYARDRSGFDQYGGNLYKSTDQGASWRLLLGPGDRSGCQVPWWGCGEAYALAIYALTSPPTLYAGTGVVTAGDEYEWYGWHFSGRALKSTDGGESWNQTGLSCGSPIFDATVAALTLAPSANPTTIYAGFCGVFKSTDGGVSWARTSLNQPVLFLEIDPAMPTTVYAGLAAEGYQVNEVFKSTDGGASWQLLSGLGDGVAALAIDRVSTTTLYAGTRAGVRKSTNAGATWSATPLSFPVSSLAIDPLNPRTLYAGTESGVYKSTDGAASWSPTALATCSGHGTPQQDGTCVCDPGYRGPSCAVLARAHADFDGDGRSDVLWRHGYAGDATGDNYLWPMNSTEILPNEGYLREVRNQHWQIAGIGDFDGDGKADILWRSLWTGENYIYLMNGVSIAGEGYLRTVADLNWRVAGVGDFNGDGRADILWRSSSSGETYIYLMNGVSIVGEGYLRTVADQSWQVAGVGDFNGDGRADILWRNSSSGENYIYLVNATSIIGEGHLRPVADQNWRVVGVADFDGDGRSDILWRNNSTGENYVYPMAGLTILQNEGYIRTVPDHWKIAPTVTKVGEICGNYVDDDGDGRDDVRDEDCGFECLGCSAHEDCGSEGWGGCFDGCCRVPL